MGGPATVLWPICASALNRLLAASHQFIHAQNSGIACPSASTPPVLCRPGFPSICVKVAHLWRFCRCSANVTAVRSTHGLRPDRRLMPTSVISLSSIGCSKPGVSR